MKSYLSSVQFTNILEALDFATKRHHGQLRKYTKEPYSVHLIEVAKMVSHLGEPFITVAVLHDILEDTNTTVLELRERFGSVIADLVLELTDPPRIAGNRAVRKKISREQLSSPFAKTVKCADCISNLPSIVQHDPGFAQDFVDELELMFPHLVGADNGLFQDLVLTHYQAKKDLEEHVRNKL